MVCGSEMSRRWAVSLISRWLPTSQATSSASSSGRPETQRRGPRLLGAFDLLVAFALAGVVQQHGEIERAAVLDLGEEFGRERVQSFCVPRSMSWIVSTAFSVCSSTVKW